MRLTGLVLKHRAAIYLAVALLTLGLLRRRDAGEQVVFDTLNVVRYLCGEHGEHR